jgi:hypothetical protein
MSKFGAFGIAGSNQQGAQTQRKLTLCNQSYSLRSLTSAFNQHYRLIVSSRLNYQGRSVIPHGGAAYSFRD